MTEDYEVVVVGGGPVGVGLALDLGRRGVSCAVIERREELSTIPKGQGLSQRTLEHLYFWGVADQVRAARTLPQGFPIGQVTVYENLTSPYWHAAAARELVKPYYFQDNERLPQYRTEAVMRRGLEKLPTVETYFGWTATQVRQDRTAVHVVAEQNGVETTFTGRYLVGCDGGHSLVREQTNIARSGTDWGELVCLVVFRSSELHEMLRRFPERTTYRVMHPSLKGYWMFFGRVDAEGEFFFHAPVPAGTTPEEFEALPLLRFAAGFDVDCTIDHVGFWDLRVQVAEEYRSGRAFIAGDAAHTHPPYGGFGLNNGLEDAANLGWKLAALLQGWGGDGLLDSYSLERQPVFRGVGEDIIGGWIEDDRRFLEHHSPQIDGEEFERHFAEMAGGFGQRLKDFEPNYEGSPVVAGPPGGVTSAHGRHTFEARPGHHLPPRVLSSGRNVFEELGEGFTLLALDTEEGYVEQIVEGAAREEVPLTVVPDMRAAGPEDYGACLVLIRPDQYVAWVGDAPPDEPRALFQKVVGRR